MCLQCRNSAPHFCGYLKQMGRDLQGISTLKEKQSCSSVRSSELAMIAIRLLFLKTDVWYSCVGLLSEEVIFLPVYAVLITAGEIRTTAHHWVKIDNLPQLFPLPSPSWSSLQNSTDHQPQENKPHIRDASITEVIIVFIYISIFFPGVSES